MLRSWVQDSRSMHPAMYPSEGGCSLIQGLHSSGRGWTLSLVTGSRTTNPGDTGIQNPKSHNSSCNRLMSVYSFRSCFCGLRSPGVELSRACCVCVSSCGRYVAERGLGISLAHKVWIWAAVILRRRPRCFAPACGGRGTSAKMEPPE